MEMTELRQKVGSDRHSEQPYLCKYTEDVEEWDGNGAPSNAYTAAPSSAFLLNDQLLFLSPMGTFGVI